MLHSGLNVAGLEEESTSKTGLMIAADENKAKSILVMLDILRQKRELKEAIDRADDNGRTPLMMAAARGHLDVVDHLVYYGANVKAKDSKGLTARDHAAAGRFKPVVDYFDEAEAEAAAAAAGGPSREAGDGLDEDGLTSTQRSKLKKKQMKEQERQAMMAAVHAAAAAKGDEMPEDLEDDGAADGAAAGAADGAGGDSSNVLPKLPAAAPPAKWPELLTAISEKRRELKVDWTVKKDEEGAAGAGPAAVPAGSDPVDPSLWHYALVNRLEVRLGPTLTSLSPAIGHLTALSTLILSGNGLTSLPGTLGLLSELKFLDVSRNALTALPPAAVLSKLAKLEVLDVSDNKLASLDSLAGLGTLTTLLADRNELTELTSASLAWPKLGRLDVLSLSYNKLTTLPDEVGLLQALTVLNASHNAIEELPSGLGDLNQKKIKDLTLLPNPIADKKVLKALNKEDKKEGVKELCKLLAASGAGGKKKGKK